MSSNIPFCNGTELPGIISNIKSDVYVKCNQEEQDYLDLMKEILDCGNEREDRTGVGTKSLFGTRLRFSLRDDQMPALTTKKLWIKGVIEELLFFIRGETDTKKLEEKGVNIWKGNTSREFLDKRGLTWFKEGDMGLGYGWQWRKFGGERETGWERLGTYIEPGVDQLQQVFDGLKNDPYNRRHIISAWNPLQLKETPLPPCHCFIQFYVDNGELSLQWYQRSVDAFLGLPFNILSYAVLTRLMAQAVGLKAKEIIFVGGDTHIYRSHIKQVEEQLGRAPFSFPKMKINKELKSIQDVEKLEFTDFEFTGYESHPTIKAEMCI